MTRNIRPLAGIAAILCTILPVWSAEISVPLLELATTGTVVDGAYVLNTHAATELSIEGGYKFGGTLRFSMDAGDLERTLGYAANPPQPIGDGDPVTYIEYNELVDRLRNSAALVFNLAKVVVRSPFGAPLDLAYFVGDADVFCSGDEFPIRFGSAPVGSGFRGYAYFPDGIGGDPSLRYDGIHAAVGTGFSVAYTGWKRVVPIFYVYQDSSLAATANLGRYSTDLRLLADGDYVKFEFFTGASFPYGDYGLYRAGALAYFSTGAGADFLAQIGIPFWNPQEDFGIDNLFFLFEPRVDFGFTSIIMTLFYHPAYYLQRETNERGVSDVNFKFLIGDLKEMAAEGGFETTIGIRGDEQAASEPFRFSLGPFFSLVTEGVRWDFKLKVHPLDYTEPLEMFETFLGVRTAF